MALIKTIVVVTIDITPPGITTDGKYLWWVGSQHDSIYMMDKNGVLIKTIAIGAIDDSPRDITTDGKYLWWVGSLNKSIYMADKL